MFLNYPSIPLPNPLPLLRYFLEVSFSSKHHQITRSKAVHAFYFLLLSLGYLQKKCNPFKVSSSRLFLVSFPCSQVEYLMRASRERMEFI